MSTALAIPKRRRPRLPPVAAIVELAAVLYRGGLTNKSCNSPDKLAVRIVAGFELGLSAVQSANWITVINGRAVIWGDAVPALGYSSGKLAHFEETFEGTEGRDDWAAVCTVRRANEEQSHTVRFSVADAKQANLWGKEGPWTEYTRRQMQMRARSWAFRDKLPDVLCGLGIAEEEMDVPAPSVKVLGVSSHTPADPATDNAVTPTVVANDDVIRRIGNARPAWLRSIGVNPDDADAVKVAWSAKLSDYGVTSAKQLPSDRAASLLEEIIQLGHAQEVKELAEGIPGN